MHPTISLLPPLFVILLVPCFLKLAARLLGRLKLTWAHAVVYGCVAASMLLMVMCIVAFPVFPVLAVFAPLPLIGALVFTLGFGIWFFASRATLLSGEKIGSCKALMLILLASAIGSIALSPLFFIVLFGARQV